MLIDYADELYPLLNIHLGFLLLSVHTLIFDLRVHFFLMFLLATRKRI